MIANSANVTMHKLIVIAAWGCLGLIVFATLSALQMRPVIAGGLFTAVERFGAYAVVGLLLYLAYPRHLAFVCIVVFGSAVSLEILQNLTPDRHGRVFDAIEKVLGGTAGLAAAGFILQLKVWSKLIGDRPKQS